MTSISPIRIAILDSGPLITLSQLDMLEAVFSFKQDVEIIITDVVLLEITSSRSPTKQVMDILDFINNDRVTVVDTSAGDIVRTLFNVGKEIPPDFGEYSIQSYLLAAKEGKLPGDPTVVMFEDSWFEDHHVSLGNVHLLSTISFLKGLKEEGYIDSHTYKGVIDFLEKNTTRKSIDIEMTAGKITPPTSWKASLDNENKKTIKEKIESFRGKGNKNDSVSESKYKP